MTQSELRKVFLKQPSLLHYSVKNTLRPKLDFFVEELCIPLTDIPRMIITCPVLMGLSLEESLRPKTAALMESCGFKAEELGRIISRVPHILVLSLKRNLLPKLEYLRDRLGLSKQQLKQLISSTPRLLMHSVKTSLEPKMKMVKAALGNKGSEKETIKMIVQNPALLVTHAPVLKQRIETGLKKNTSIDGPSSVKIALQPRSQGLTQQKRPVLEMDPVTDKVIREYPSVSIAAEKLGISSSNVYNICRTGREWKGKKLVYGSLRDEKDTTFLILPQSSPTDDDDEPQVSLAKRKPFVFKDLKSALKASDSILPPATTDSTMRIAVYVSGRVYPPSAKIEARGTRRAGGMALWFPQINDSHGPELAMRLRFAAKKSFGQIMRMDENGEGTCYGDGRILIGFPYLRPSQNRCELYACHEAIKVVAQLLKHEASVVSLQNETVQVDVYTDSDYAWKLLHNTTRLHSWGATVNEKEFVYDGPGPVWRANPDLLHPLCRTYFRLVEQQDSDEALLELGKEINVTFHHAAESMTSLHRYAKQAALWMDRRAKTAIKL